jgi:flagellar basal-body rod protein FlgB
MLNQLGDALNYHGEALKLRAERQRVLASNIANADTPNYKATDFDFKSALSSAVAGSTGSANSVLNGAVRTDPRHLATSTSTLSLPGVDLQYRTPNQLSIDGNTVEMDAERASFADNAVRYEASLRFLNAQIKALNTAIQGQ